MKRVATGIFFVALLLNVKITLDGPYFLVGHELAAETTGTGTDSGTGDNTSGGGGLLWEEVQNDILCGEVKWKKTEYFNSKGTLVGTMLVENGIVKLQYSGIYSYTIESTGTTPPRWLKITECPKGWELFCTKCLDPCKGC